MPTCRVCGEDMPASTRTCRECGSALPEFTSTVSAPPRPPKKRRPPAKPVPNKLPPGGRFCPSCATVYDADYIDAFCICGAELTGLPPVVAEMPLAPEPVASDPDPEPVAPDPEPPIAVMLEPPPVAASLPAAPTLDASPAAPSQGSKPPVGTHCLVLYGPDRQPLHWFALTKDATLIGRLDAPSGNFPDIDVDEWLDAVTARRISRQHALVLRSRITGDFALRPLPGNTGTQVEVDMVMPMNDYPLAPGQRVILGGVARFKFEIS